MHAENTQESRRPCKPQNPGGNTKEQDHLPCPRCDSPNTKFCYYNNYNFSQPRHFCKSCRRYWTQGGTLRDIPVGGGIRKNAKRSRTVPSSSLTTVSSHATQDRELLPGTATPFFVSLSGSPSDNVANSGDFSKQNLNMYGSFTSLLSNSTSQCPRYVALAQLGLDVDMDPAFEDVSFGMGGGVSPFPDYVGGGVQVRRTGVGSTWQFENGTEARFDGRDCYSSLMNE